MTHIIYKITSKTTNLSYIGETSLTIEKRWKSHIRCAEKFMIKNKKLTKFHYEIINQGKNNWNLEILEENILPEKRIERERYWISIHDTLNNGYNMNKGGGGAAFFTEDVKLKMSKNRKGKTVTDETKRKISEGNKGKYVSDETRRKISETNKNRLVSQETKEKLRISGIGRKLSNESKLKISKVQKGRKKSKEQIEKHKMFMMGKNFRACNYKVIEPNGNEIIIHDLKKYCKDNNLNNYNMYAVAAGRRNHHKNYRCNKILNNKEVLSFSETTKGVQ